MFNSKKRNCLLLYFGTSRIVALRVSAEDGDEITVEHCSQIVPQGFSEGLVSEMEIARQEVYALLKSVCEGGDYDALPCYIVLSNSRIRHYKVSSSMHFQQTKTIDQQDIEDVIQQTKSVATLPLDEEIISTLPQEYIVNDLFDIRNPLDLEGKRLGAALHVFTLPISVYRAFNDLFESLDLEVEIVLPRFLGTAFGITSKEEREEGVLCIDFSAKFADLTYCYRGALRQIARFDWGFDRLTQAVAKEWDMTARHAERLIDEFGSVHPENPLREDMIPIMDGRGQVRSRIPQSAFLDLLRATVSDGIQDLTHEIKAIQRHCPHLYNIVVNGRLSSLPGMVEMFQGLLNVPTRVAFVSGVHGPKEIFTGNAFTPVIATLKALVNEDALRGREGDNGLFSRSWGAFKNWFEDYF